MGMQQSIAGVKETENGEEAMGYCIDEAKIC